MKFLALSGFLNGINIPYNLLANHLSGNDSTMTYLVLQNAKLKFRTHERKKKEGKTYRDTERAKRSYDVKISGKLM